jgi:hypothetical protein
MPLEKSRVTKLIGDNLSDVPDRCEGYREELLDCLNDIVMEERQHQIQGTPIQNNINDICDNLGKFLTNNEV